MNVQLKSTDAPAARLATLAGVQAVQPVPLTFTLVIVDVPVLVSVTVIVTAVPDRTFVAGETVFVVSVVDACSTVTDPLVVSPASDTGWFRASVP